MKKLISTTLPFLLLLLLSNCKKDSTNPNNPNNPNGLTIVHVTSDIDTNTTWTKGNIYVVSNVVKIHAKLTIQAGVIVKFDHGSLDTYSPTGFPISGNIDARGTATDPIIFTSIKDDANGGDTNGDGTASNPQPGDWGYLQLASLIDPDVFQYCKFFYSGSWYYVIHVISNHAVTIDHCTFAHIYSTDPSAVYDYHTVVLDMQDATPASSITNSTFYDCGATFGFCSQFIVSGNVFHNPANANEINKSQCVYVVLEQGNNGAAWFKNKTFDITEVPYVFNMPYSAPLTDTITLANNVIFKINPAPQALFQLQQGGYIKNYNGQGVIFTSGRDDAHGGDSNADGIATSPQTGDWAGIQDLPNSTYITSPNILYSSH